MAAKKKTTKRASVMKSKKPAAKKTMSKSKPTKPAAKTRKLAAPKPSAAKIKKTATKPKVEKPTQVKKPKAPEKVIPYMQEEHRQEVHRIEKKIEKRRSTATVIGSLNFTPYELHKNELYMSEAQREHFRKILELWKQQLMKEVDETVGHLKEDAIVYPDPLDRASQEQGFNLELRTRDRERKLIKKIEQALDALKKGEYGYCEDCGAEIGIRRLEARPTADKCIDCKTYEEIREKQVGAV